MQEVWDIHAARLPAVGFVLRRLYGLPIHLHGLQGCPLGRWVRLVIIVSEADIAKVPSLQDRRELRNFMRFLKLWPTHGYEMVEREVWKKYLGLSSEEVVAMQKGYVWKSPT
jgi:hypothetical protein